MFLIDVILPFWNSMSKSFSKVNSVQAEVRMRDVQLSDWHQRESKMLAAQNTTEENAEWGRGRTERERVQQEADVTSESRSERWWCVLPWAAPVTFHLPRSLTHLNLKHSHHKIRLLHLFSLWDNSEVKYRFKTITRNNWIAMILFLKWNLCRNLWQETGI